MIVILISPSFKLLPNIFEFSPHSCLPAGRLSLSPEGRKWGKLPFPFGLLKSPFKRIHFYVI